MDAPAGELATASPTEYDRHPYHGQPMPLTDCRRLAAVAAYFGMTPAPPVSARVLELGCGDGANLLAQARGLPQARFVGCDVAGSAIERARASARDAGIENVDFRHADFANLDETWGSFDYILCYGVYSWVEPSVRRRILNIIRSHLAPHGVAFISYNALPGWHLRTPVSDLLRLHVEGCQDAEQAVALARSVLALTVGAQRGDTGYAKVLRDEYFHVSMQEDWHVFHDVLANANQPLYCLDFFRQACSAGMQFLAQADPARMSLQDCPPEVRSFLEGLSLERREQYHDFFRGTAFRNDLLCHQECALNREVDPCEFDDATFTRESDQLQQHLESSTPSAPAACDEVHMLTR